MSESLSFSAEFISAIDQIDATQWDALAKSAGPFLSHGFLLTLEQSGSVGEQTGWTPCHGLLYQNDRLVGIAPLYIKGHSYGEYVFDFAWANAYAQHGMAYYPKFVNAVPFTPVTGPRVLIAEDVDENRATGALVQAIRQQADTLGISSLHSLFVPKQQSLLLGRQGMAERLSVQFQWFNRGYQDFSDFLQHFTARRRKSVTKERKKIASQGVTVSRHWGSSLTQAHMALFYDCYRVTYLKRSGHEGYLTREFFSSLLDMLPDKLMLVIAHQQERAVGAALYLFDDTGLYGRYWGALTDVDGLHFECCYYQGIEFCIDQGLPLFNPGTQGEHKILRGFEPIFCYSRHWLAEPAFDDAVRRFLVQESPGIEHYKRDAETLLPFKQTA